MPLRPAINRNKNGINLVGPDERLFISPGLDYRNGELIFPAGVGGHIRAYINEILVSVGTIKVPCKVLFSDEFTVKFNLLGRAGIFDRFRVCFDDSEKKICFY